MIKITCVVGRRCFKLAAGNSLPTILQLENDSNNIRQHRKSLSNPLFMLADFAFKLNF
jgi:hypothetical protein